MTREEAIEFGNMWTQINEDCKDSSTYAFFQMAIKALENQKSVIEELEHLKAVIRFNGLYNEQIEDLIDTEIKEWKGDQNEEKH